MAGQNDNSGDFVESQKTQRDANRPHAVLGEGKFVAHEDRLDYGYQGYAADGVGVNDAATAENSFGGAADSGPSVSQPGDEQAKKEK